MAETLREMKVAQTKQLLKDVLIELIEEKGFDGVTVRDLTLRAKLNRGTFYLHYLDKYDLMEKVQDELLQGFQEIMKDTNPVEVMKYYTEGMPHPNVTKLFEYLKEKKHFLKLLLSEKGDPAFSKKLKAFLKNHLVEKIMKVFQNEQFNMVIPEEYFLAFLSSAFLGVIEQWLESDPSPSPEEMAMTHLRLVRAIRNMPV